MVYVRVHAHNIQWPETGQFIQLHHVQNLIIPNHRYYNSKVIMVGRNDFELCCISVSASVDYFEGSVKTLV